jgi:hypothetical protein
MLVFLVAAPQDVLRSSEDVQAWVTYYYLNPRPDLVIPSLDLVDRDLQRAQGRSLADEVNLGGIRTFYAKLLEQNPAVVREVERKLATLPVGQQAFMREALRRCGTDGCRAVLRSPSSPPAAVQLDPGALDDSWAAFFATGEEKYVREVIEVLPWSEVHGDVNRLLVGGAAKWSLASNAYQHARVLSICEKVSAESTGPRRRLLDDIITQAKAERAKKLPPEPK